MKVESSLHPRPYFLKEVCRIIDPKQHMLYVKNGKRPIDMYTSVDFNNGKDIVVYVYLREETADVYELWKKHELE